VNLTNPMMMKGPIREIVPIPRQQLRISIPDGHTVTAAHLLVANRQVPFNNEREAISLEVPSIGIHEVVALDLRTT